jgi:hypothetical protein
MYGFICIYSLFNIVFPLPSTTYQIKSHSLVVVEAAGGGGGGRWRRRAVAAVRRRWNVPRCGGAAGTLLSGGGAGTLLSGGAVGTTAVQGCGGGCDFSAWELEEDKVEVCPNFLLDS